MASFAHFLSKKVTVQYRVGDVLLPASGTLSADSGRSIFLEQHVEQRGKLSYFRWEIPYQYIHRIEAVEESEPPGSIEEAAAVEPAGKRAAAAGAGSAPESSTGLPAASLMTLPPRPKPV
jgi:hypothetical protein